ncbi:hypothetical protein TPAR_07567, partial [Tolypocladium paradoxum]
QASAAPPRSSFSFFIIKRAHTLWIDYIHSHTHTSLRVLESVSVLWRPSSAIIQTPPGSCHTRPLYDYHLQPARNTPPFHRQSETGVNTLTPLRIPCAKVQGESQDHAAHRRTPRPPTVPDVPGKSPSDTHGFLLEICEKKWMSSFTASAMLRILTRGLEHLVGTPDDVVTVTLDSNDDSMSRTCHGTAHPGSVAPTRCGLPRQRGRDAGSLHGTTSAAVRDDTGAHGLPTFLRLPHA